MCEVKQYRKKPVIIEAMQLITGNKGSIEKVINWTGAYQWYVDMKNPDETFICISTLEGTMKIKNNDWVICGVNGEFYPCHNDIFIKTYDEVVHDEVASDPNI
jgi:hypothetical protein